MPTAEQLRRLAEEAAAHLAQIIADRDEAIARHEADMAEFERLISLAAGQVDATRGMLEMAERGTSGVLHTRSPRGRVNDVNAEAKLNMSRASSDDPFVKQARLSGLTQNDIARALKIPASLLSMYRKGVRRIPSGRAEAVEKLIGWKATAKNWPGGIVEGD